MDPITSLQNLSSMLLMSLDFTMKRIEDAHSVVPEGIKLSHECHLFHTIIQDVIDKPYLPINLIIQDVYKMMNETNDLIEKFLKRDDRTGRPFIRNAAWKIRRVLAAYEHRVAFKDATEYLRVSKKNIKTNLALSAQLSTPTVYSYSNDMVNHESFAFWKATCGEALHAPSWSLFMETYQQRYNVFFDHRTLDRIHKIVCRDGTNSTITGYVLLTRLCDFPINVAKLNALDLSGETIPLTANYYKKDMVNSDCFRFWMETCGNVVQIPEWITFVTIYQDAFKVYFDKDDLALIRRVVSPDGTQMSITGYIQLTQSCGFPIDLTKMLHMDPAAEEAALNRMKITQKINGLISKYASPEMRDALVTITAWYKGYARHDAEEWDDRAKDWAVLVNNLDEKNMDDQDKLVRRVDNAQMTCVSFFQDYKQIYEMDQIGKDMLVEVDFPGKARIYEFLDFVKPLQKAHYQISNPSTSKPWKEPPLFKFLEDLVEKKAKPSKKKEKASKIIKEKLTRQRTVLISDNQSISTVCLDEDIKSR